MFYCDPLPAPGASVHLRGDEARHAGAARRLKSGDMLWLFDGRGTIARARLRALHDRGHELEAVIEERTHEAAPRPVVHLACALPKGDRAAVLLDMSTQLGIASFTPLICERNVVEPGAGALERLRRVSLEACKQSRRAHLPHIHAPATLADVIARGGTCWIAHPGGEQVTTLAANVDQTLTLLIGPEGGFTDDEVAHTIARGATRVTLGNTVLRVETAAVALVGRVMLGANARE